MPTTLGKTTLAAVLGMAAGAAVTGVLYSYPKTVIARHRYCLDCASYEETYDEHSVLGADHRRTSDHGPLGSLLGGEPGTAHEHRFTEWTTVFPTFGAPAEHPEIAQRVESIRAIEGNAHSLSLLDQAMRNDQERGTRLIRWLIAPGADASWQVLRELDRDTPWPERWAAVDAAMATGR